MSSSDIEKEESPVDDVKVARATSVESSEVPRKRVCHIRLGPQGILGWLLTVRSLGRTKVRSTD